MQLHEPERLLSKEAQAPGRRNAGVWGDSTQGRPKPSSISPSGFHFRWLFLGGTELVQELAKLWKHSEYFRHDGLLYRVLKVICIVGNVKKEIKESPWSGTKKDSSQTPSPPSIKKKESKNEITRKKVILLHITAQLHKENKPSCSEVNGNTQSIVREHKFGLNFFKCSKIAQRFLIFYTALWNITTTTANTSHIKEH